jgi:hypothetical protein
MVPILTTNTLVFLFLAVIWNRSSGFNMFMKFLFWGLTVVNGVTLFHALGFVVRG